MINYQLSISIISTIQFFLVWKHGVGGIAVEIKFFYWVWQF